jgi:hypothetical protein
MNPVQVFTFSFIILPFNISHIHLDLKCLHNRILTGVFHALLMPRVFVALVDIVVSDLIAPAT